MRHLSCQIGYSEQSHEQAHTNKIQQIDIFASFLHHFCIISDNFYLQNPPDQLLGEGKEMPSQDMNFADRTRPQPRQKPQPKRRDRRDRRDRRSAAVTD